MHFEAIITATSLNKFMLKLCSSHWMHTTWHSCKAQQESKYLFINCKGTAKKKKCSPES